MGLVADDRAAVSPSFDVIEAASVFDVYDELLVPLCFQGYADDLAARLGGVRDGDVLVVACGTGVDTRALADALPPSVTITATDLVPGMVERAEQRGTSRASHVGRRRRAGTALRRRVVRRRGVPVRRHVLPVEGRSVHRGRARPASPGSVRAGGVGPHRGERLRRHRRRRDARALPRRPARVPRPDAVLVPRCRRDRRRTRGRRARRARRGRAGGSPRPGPRHRRPSPPRSAAGRRCATSSRRADPIASAAPSTAPRVRSPSGSAPPI